MADKTRDNINKYLEEKKASTPSKKIRALSKLVDETDDLNTLRTAAHMVKYLEVEETEKRLETFIRDASRDKGWNTDELTLEQIQQLKHEFAANEEAAERIRRG